MYTSVHKDECQRSTHSCPDATLRALIEEQTRVGLNAFTALQRMQSSLINTTVFAPMAKSIHQKYEPFLPTHCKLL